MKRGLDRIETVLSLVKGKRVGLVANAASVDRFGRSSLEIFEKETCLAAVFGLEHGITVTFAAGEKVDGEQAGKLRVFSLYGGNGYGLSKEARELIDVLVFDIQDLGLRFYTYVSSLRLILRSAAEMNLPVIILDRPNPLGRSVYGTLLDESDLSFVGIDNLPIRYGLTIGELALFFNANIGADLRVVPLDGWTGGLWQGRWVPTSPNIPTFETAFVYSGMCFLEGTNLSEGRGTDAPFLTFGAPFMTRDLSFSFEGFELERTTFIPSSSKYQGELCHGYRIRVTDYGANPVEFSLRLMNRIFEEYDEMCFPEGKIASIRHLLGSRESEMVKNDLPALLAKCDRDALYFRTLMSRFILY